MKNTLIHSIILISSSIPGLLYAENNAEFSQYMNEFKQHKQAEMMEFDQYKQELEEGFKAYKKVYTETFNAYKNSITEHWGEFKKSPPSTWVSYAKSGNVRRTVDYVTAEVQVELLVNKGTGIDQVRTELDKAVYSLMNTTEREAYKSDIVANLVERELSNYPNVIQKGDLSDERLFTLSDLTALQINHNGYFKVSSTDKNIAVTDKREAQKKDKEIIRVTFKVPHSIHERALKYAEAVSLAAKKEKIDEQLIFAIMETESSFNPMAKSYVPAYGLMQIVPRTAGRDATSYLYGKAKLLAPSYLFKPENNITIGAAYLHVLHYRYMRKVKDHQSRMYCAIAAYNTGSSNVAKAFINQASFNRAAAEINKLESQQVYEKLKNYLPQKETRQYVKKVAERMEKYQ